MPLRNFQDQMAGVYPKQDSNGDGRDRKHQGRDEEKEMELDRSRAKKGSNG